MVELLFVVHVGSFQEEEDDETMIEGACALVAVHELHLMMACRQKSLQRTWMIAEGVDLRVLMSLDVG